MAEKKKGSCLGKIILFLFLAVVLGVPGYMTYYGQTKMEPAKWVWQWEEADWSTFWGDTKATAADLKTKGLEKWGELITAGKEKWAELSSKVKHKTDKTEQLFVNREAIKKELEALRGSLAEESSRDEYQKSVGWGIDAFENALKEWEASLMWDKASAEGGLQRAKSQLDKAVNNFAEAQTKKADEKVGQMLEWAKEYQADFQERIELIKKEA